MSSTQAINPEISTWARVQNAAADSVKWGTKVVQNITESIGSFAKSVVDYVRPLFAAIGKFFSENFAIVKEWLKEHKEKAVVALVSIGVTAIVYSLFYSICCTGNESTKQVAEKANTAEQSVEKSSNETNTNPEVNQQKPETPNRDQTQGVQPEQK